MKRGADTTAVLVYAYGCAEPLSGLDHAEREAEKMAALWDRLVGIERDHERETEAACAADVPEAAALLHERERLTEQIGAARKAGAAKSVLDPLHAERRGVQRALWPLQAAWRKAHPDTVRAIEQRRRAAVVIARQDFTVASRDPLYWGNSNAVIQRYDTARQVTRQFGRRLRLSDLARDEACLTVQIPRTRSGLGAAPAELMDGTYAHVQIGRIDPAIYAGRARPRAYRTTVSMRIDAEGHHLVLPVWMHRPLPEDCRIKQAQIVWWPEGPRRRYRLCLTVSQPRVERRHASPHAATVRIAPRIDWRPSESHPEHPRARIAVADVTGSDGHSETILLDEDWVREMDRVDHLPAVIADETLPQRLRRDWARQREGARRRLLGRRRELYRLAAHRLAQAYGRIVIETPHLAVAAWTERGTEANAVRHRACAHQLIAEIRHQAAKAGGQVDVIVAESPASAPVPLRVRGRKNKILASARVAETGALAQTGSTP